jgi:hypothetical protein
MLGIYYAATAVFLALDYLAGINVRVAFLEPWPAWRVVYYLFCFGCLGVIAWRPALTMLVSTVESLMTLAALIIAMGFRVMGQSAAAPESGGGFVSPEEIVNFVIAGSVAWLGWFQGSRALHDRLRR